VGKNLFAFFPAPNLEDEKSLVPVNFVPEVNVNALCENNTNLSFNGKNRIGPIPKGCSINFSISNINELP
jgi:hypothetical protein